MLIIEDSEDSNAKKMVQVGNLPVGSLTNETYGFRFPASTTEEGADYNRTTGSGWVSQTCTVKIIVPLKIVGVKWDLKAGTYNLFIDSVDYGQKVVGSDTTDVHWDLSATPLFLFGPHEIEVVRSASAQWWDRNAGTFRGNLFYMDGITYDDNKYYDQYTAPVRLVAYSGFLALVE